MQQKLDKGEDTFVDGNTPDPNSQRLDYVFVGADPDADAAGWIGEDVKVGMTARHPELKCSLSDHFSVEATIVRMAGRSSDDVESLKAKPAPPLRNPLPLETYDEILAMVDRRGAHKAIRGRAAQSVVIASKNSGGLSRLAGRTGQQRPLQVEHKNVRTTSPADVRARATGLPTTQAAPRGVSLPARPVS